MKAEDPSVHEVGSGCPLAGSFLDWEPGWNPRLQEGKEKQCPVRKHVLSTLSAQMGTPQGTLSVKSPSWRDLWPPPSSGR